MNVIEVAVTFRHIDPTEALKQYAERKLQKLAKYFAQSATAHVVLAVDAKGSQMAEIELHRRGAPLCAKEHDGDLYAAIDLALDKLERQIRKQKEKSKQRRTRTSS